MAGFFKKLVNRILRGGTEAPPLPPEPPWIEAPGIDAPPAPEPIEDHEAPNLLDNISLYDNFGNYIGTENWQGWWDATIYLKYQGDIHVINLIQVIEDEYDIEWDWQAWREAYAAAHAAV